MGSITSGYGSRIVDPHTADVHVGEVRLRTLRTGSGTQPIVFAHGMAVLIGHSIGRRSRRSRRRRTRPERATCAGRSAASSRYSRAPGVPEDWTADRSLHGAVATDVAADSAPVSNPRWADVDIEPWARAKRTVDPSVTSWVSSSADIDGWRAVLTDVTCPALLFVGDAIVDDNVTVRDAEAREAQTLCPALEVVHVPGAGHSIRRDRFDLVLPAVREFLSRLVANEERPARPLR